MPGVAKIELEPDVADAAAARAAQEGVSLTAYVSLLLRRTFERTPGEASILAYDHASGEGAAAIDREPGEDDESYRRRSALYADLFRP